MGDTFGTVRAEFDDWYRQCDRVCLAIAGIGIDDLPDGNSWDAWDNGETPSEYVREKLDSEGYPGQWNR